MSQSDSFINFILWLNAKCAVKIGAAGDGPFSWRILYDAHFSLVYNATNRISASSLANLMNDLMYEASYNKMFDSKCASRSAPVRVVHLARILQRTAGIIRRENSIQSLFSNLCHETSKDFLFQKAIFRTRYKTK